MELRAFFKLIASVAAFTLLTACSSEDENVWPDGKRIPLSENAREVCDRANNFGNRLFRKVVSDLEADGENMCISPYSVFVTLSLLANGDNGGSRDQLLDMFGLKDGGSAEVINEFNETMLRYLPIVDRNTDFSTANSLWYDPDLSLVSRFESVLQQSYAASVFNVSPGGKSGMDAINSWVSDNTLGMIEKMVEEPKDWRFAVVNAIAFKGKWKKKFLKKDTTPGNFTNIDGTISSADYMYVSDSFRYMEAEGAQVIELDYGNGRFAMFVVLPPEDVDFRDFTQIFNLCSLIEVRERAPLYKVHLYFPKFETETKDADFIKKIKEMGLSSLNFNAMFTGTPVSLTDVIHSAHILVNEEGTEAVASTSGNGMVSANGDIGEITLRIDRPFLFVIEETSTGTILFAGQQVKF